MRGDNDPPTSRQWDLGHAAALRIGRLIHPIRDSQFQPATTNEASAFRVGGIGAKRLSGANARLAPDQLPGTEYSISR